MPSGQGKSSGAPSRRFISNAQKRAIQSRQQIAKEKREGKLRQARPLWSLPIQDISSEAIAQQVGLSTVTLRHYLGNRRKQQKKKAPEGNKVSGG